MKKLFLLLMFFVVTLVTVYSQQNWVTIMSENFEGTFPSANWVSSSNGYSYANAYWAKVSNDAHTGTSSAWCAAGGTDGISPTLGYYPDNTNTWMVYGPFDLSDALAARFSFYSKYSTEPTNDFLYYGVSIDNGTFSGNYLSGTSNTWNKYTLNLDDNLTAIGNLCGRKNIRIAFNFQSNGSYNHYTGAYIDDILLEKYSPINLSNIDFETIGQNWSWKFTEATNSTYSIVNNPSTTGINTSSKCLKFTDSFGYCTNGTCIGDEMSSFNIGDLTFTKDNCKIKIMVYKSGISDVRVRFYNVELQNYYEQIVSNTNINKWEELTFDFTDYIGYKVDEISIFPDSRNNITEDGYCYIDNISFNPSISIPTNITYTVTVPTGTKACYIAGDMNTWTQQAMNKINETLYSITLTSLLSDGYKYCSGPDWAYEELDANSNIIANRSYSTKDTVARWRAIYMPTGLDTQYANEKVSINPNPAENYFQINGLEGSYKVIITDLSGKTVLIKQVINNEQVSISNLSKGIYILKLNSVEGIIERKLVKQ